MSSLSPAPLSPESLDRLQSHAGARGIHLKFGADTLTCAAHTMRDWLPAGSWGLVCDRTTWAVAGHTVASLPGDTLTHQIAPRADTGVVTAGDIEEAELVAGLQAQGAVAAIAVGSGTINDLTRGACDRLGIPYAVVPTAPSMNGYLSAGVALLVDGVKTTRACPAPVGCLVDARILDTAPATMCAAGYGDLRSRVTSCADWALSHLLTSSDYVPAALDLVAQADDMVDGIADALAAGDSHATMRLTAGLLLSGLAMDMAGSSAPSSGAEHLVSHLIDMEHYTQGLPHDLHGRQVGVATIAMASMYEQLLDLDRSSIDLPQLSARRPWRMHEAELAGTFGPLWPAIRATARTTDRVADEAVTERLQRFLTCDLDPIRASLTPARQLRQDLAAAGAPVSFAQLGLDQARARHVLLAARHIRDRYTILDLAAELGLLEDWVEKALLVVCDG